jgi:O-acetyl-ADP-ribose deacetylase (regulator of RNase III)
MKQVTGDLLDLAETGHFDVIVHGCNCFHTMGAGIAKAIAARYPQALVADKTTPNCDRAKLGTISTARVTKNGHAFEVVNAYTQHHWRGRGLKADFGAIEAAMRLVANRYAGLRIAYPLIGAGLAGGDWSEIAPRIATALAGQDHTLVLLPT